MATHPISKLAIVVGGGPAPGINGVISAVTLQANNNGIQVYGMMDGYKHLVQGKREVMGPLTKNDVRYLDLRGGSMLRTSRTNPTKNQADMDNVLRNFREMEIDALVSIGGDDTAYSASQVHHGSAGKIRVAHVPKTIDNDLPLPGSTPTFGFETARQLGTYIVRNMAEDARTTSRWYLIVSMGRAAGHLALGIGKASAATLTIISEEFRDRTVTIDELCDIVIGSIIKREADGLKYGAVVLAEGLIEAIGAKALAATFENDKTGRYGQIIQDQFGHLRLGEIEFGRMFRDALTDRLTPLGLKTMLVDKDLGYELRCANPIPFDSEYTRDLGYGAVKFLLSEQAGNFGAIISYVQGHMEPLPFDTMIDPETRRMKTRLVNVNGEGYECARRYMIRLEKRDFENVEFLAKMAAVVHMTPQQFRDRFAYLVG